MKESPLLHAHDCILNFNSFHPLSSEVLCSAEGVYIALMVREQPEHDGKIQSLYQVSCVTDTSN